MSAIALGGWLTLGGTLDEASSLALLHEAVDRGITFFDLADVYGNGEAERIVGRFLRTIPRDRVVLSSKVFFPTGPGPDDRGLSRGHVTRAIERSLANLGTDHLDVYFCHREDPTTPLEETVSAMDALVRAGKTRSWGTSCFRPRTLIEAHARARLSGRTPPLVEQPHYNLLDRHVEERVLPTARTLGMGVVAFSPLAGGVLTGKYLTGVPEGSRAATSPAWIDRYRTPEATEKVGALVALAREVGESPVTLALAFLLRDPTVASVIAGATKTDHVRAAARAGDYVLPADVADRIAAIFRPARPGLFGRVTRRVRRFVSRGGEHGN